MPDHAEELSGEDAWSVIHYVQSLIPRGVEERAGAHPMMIRASRVSGEIADGTAAIVWQKQKVKPTYVAVSPLWWRADRIQGVYVQAIHNGADLAIRLSWEDETVSASALRTEDFPDAVAVQLSAAADPPFFGMGSARGEVNVWHWKASWQRDVPICAVLPDPIWRIRIGPFMRQRNWALEQQIGRYSTVPGVINMPGILPERLIW